MNLSLRHSQVSFPMDISWSKNNVIHEDRFFVNSMNCWRDLIPGSFLYRALNNQPKGAETRMIQPGDVVPLNDKNLVMDLAISRLNDMVPYDGLVPGRYYPQGMVMGVPGIFKGNLTPFLCVHKNETGIRGDFNHALAGIPLAITVGPIALEPMDRERGGSCTDWMETALTGPGMQAGGFGPLNPAPFNRQDNGPDREFYARDRMVHHIDDQARITLAQWYRSLLSPGDRVLDLMAGWESHLPEDMVFSFVHGLGLNANELAANSSLSAFGVQDLNQNPYLKFADHSFDGVICSLSVEYLTDPVAVFREAARVLRPGGRFAVAFSNRWFPEKAMDLWPQLHEFERLGLVLDFFRESSRFSTLSTLSVRGYPRPPGDRYASKLRVSDPIFGVEGKTRE